MQDQKVVYVPTYSGLLVDVLNPRVEDIRLEDIARSHANVCRYLGHSHNPYSVGEHAIRVAVACYHNVGFHMARAALVHDASEAYLGEVVRSIKHSPLMDAYRALEAKWEEVIRYRFKIDPIMTRNLKPVDLAMCRVEIGHSGIFPNRWDPDTVTFNGPTKLVEPILKSFDDGLGPIRPWMLGSWAWAPHETYARFLWLATYLEVM